MTCEGPKCYLTKAHKCIYPNAWIIFLQKNAGKGLSRPELKHKYNKWKRAKLPVNSTVQQRRDFLCAEIARNPITPKNKTTSKKKTIPRRKISGTIAWRSPSKDLKRAILEKTKINMAQTLRDMVKKDTKERREKISKIEIIRSKKKTRALLKKFQKHVNDLVKKARKAKLDAKEAEKKVKKAEKAKKNAAKEVKRAKTRRTLALMAGAIYDIGIAKEAEEKKKEDAKVALAAKKLAQADLRVQEREMVGMENQDGDVGRIIRENNRRIEALMTCKIPSSHRKSILLFETKANSRDGDDVEFFMGLPSYETNETSCFYVKRVFNMSETLRPLEFVGNKVDYIIYTGLSLHTPVFIKVSSMRKESDLKLHRYSVHMQKKIHPIFKNNKLVSTPKLLEHNTFSFDGGRGGVQAAETVPGITVGKFLRTEIAIDSIISKTATLLGEMHRKGVIHGDAHMENFMFDGLTGTLTAIDLERSLVYTDNPNISEVQFESAKTYDVMFAGISIIFANNQNRRTKVPHERLLELFMKKYVGGPISAGDRWWSSWPKDIILQDQIGKAYQKLYLPVMVIAVANLWEKIRRKQENLIF